MHRVVLTLVTVLSLGGCLFFNDSPQEREYAVCYAYCDCVAVDIEACITNQCMPVLPVVSDPCFECVSQNSNSCTILDNLCSDLCFP